MPIYWPRRMSLTLWYYVRNEHVPAEGEVMSIPCPAVLAPLAVLGSPQRVLSHDPALKSSRPSAVTAGGHCPPPLHG